MQLSRLSSCCNRTGKLHWPEKNQFPRLLIRRHPHGAPSRLPKENAAKEVSGVEQIGQSVPDDRGRRNNKI